jgi:hypothetical protein
MLAIESGIRVGDVLTGINNDYFSPGAEVQDVIDILQMTGIYVTLHFTRRHKPDDPSNSPFHKFVQLLLDQEVITRDKGGYITKVMYRLKDRVLQWDGGFITQRIESWKLDSGINVSLSSRSLNSSGKGGSGGSGSSGSSNNGSRKSDLVMYTKNLRPAISVRILRAEERVDHTVYIIWVLDVKSGAEWYIRRRFREFHEFREVFVVYFH